ncbi:putative membrane protein [Neobacillus ginsengisoli]|uniref:Membrane protein n=1 Tax=Neobacillus ginsengisoli TaxID=904295 RepID=A0ABT9Y3A6_9BACI|nr:putative membrane protein [Neobacillus ginsengisoli]
MYLSEHNILHLFTSIMPFLDLGLTPLMPEIFSNKYHDSFLQYLITFFTNNHIPLEAKEINFIKEYFKSVSKRHEFKIMAMEFDQNSVKLIINCQTTHFIPNIIKALKMFEEIKVHLPPCPILPYKS